MVLKIVAALIVLAVLVLSAYVRLAPTAVATWHVPIATMDAATPGPCTDKVTIVPKGARATCLVTGTPAEVLNRLDATALTSARTIRLAGTPDEGRITWEARSFLMGYPDYITAEASLTPQGTRLDIFSRQRFGEGDMGVNAARLKDWLSHL
jgi:uncharacterized protein (DUF1499 family)